MAERHPAVRVGKVTAVAHAGAQSLDHLVHRLSSRGYEVRETPHFAVLRRSPRDDRLLLMHTFDETTIDEDLSPIVAGELGPLGVLASPQEFGDALIAVVTSTSGSLVVCPRCGVVHLDQSLVWRRFCLNTLERLRPLVGGPAPTAILSTSHIALFAAIYRRIVECRVGDSLLDVGSNLGLMPVLLAEVDRTVTVVGCDNRQTAITCAADLARATDNHQVTFMLRDVLSPDFAEVGRFDTVTAVHLLEHLTEDQVPIALDHLLRATRRRLIVAVPYEETVQPLFGHEQAFTPELLRTWGGWCVETLGGGRFHCEDVGGGFLVVDRPGRPGD
jgi:SAM-dependent methyltransferase